MTRPAVLFLSTCSALTFAFHAKAFAESDWTRERNRTAYKFTSVDIPGAQLTDVRSVNRHGDAVGLYRKAGVDHGLLVTRDGVISTLDVPGATSTWALGINDRGEIVGRYFDINPVDNRIETHAYLRSRGKIITLECSNELVLGEARGINDRGDIVGSTADGTHAIVLRGTHHGSHHEAHHSKCMIIDIPGATATLVSSINSRGDIVGTYYDDTTAHGFLMADDEVITIDGPDATATELFGINDRGDIVGDYDTANSGAGFILSNGRFIAVSVPFTGATGTAPEGIADTGEIVGSYGTSGGSEHGFIGVPKRRCH